VAVAPASSFLFIIISKYLYYCRHDYYVADAMDMEGSATLEVPLLDDMERLSEVDSVQLKEDSIDALGLDLECDSYPESSPVIIAVSSRLSKKNPTPVRSTIPDFRSADDTLPCGGPASASNLAASTVHEIGINSASLGSSEVVKNPRCRTRCRSCKAFLGKGSGERCLRCGNKASSKLDVQCRPQKTVGRRKRGDLSRYRFCRQCGFLLPGIGMHCKRCCGFGICGKHGNLSRFRRNCSSRPHISYEDILTPRDDASRSFVAGMIQTLSADDIELRSVLTDDKLILQYGSLRARKFRDSGNSEVAELRRELRALAGVVAECRREVSSADLGSLIQPDHFNLVVAAVRGRPGPIVEVLGQTVNVKIVDALQRDDDREARRAWNFRELYTLWRDSLVADRAVLKVGSGNAQCQSSLVADRLGGCRSKDLESWEGCSANTRTMSSVLEGGLGPSSSLGVDSEDSQSQPNHGPPIEEPQGCSSATLHRDGQTHRTTDSSNSTASNVADRIPENVVDSDVSGSLPADDDVNSFRSSAVAATHRSSPVTGELGSSGISSTLAVSSSAATSTKLTVTSGISLSRSCRENTYCYYCGARHLDIESHWRSDHAGEGDVAQLSSLGSDEARCRHVAILTNLGNHRHNEKVLCAGRGTLVVLYSSDFGAKPGDYAPCAGCWNYLTRAQMDRHRCSAVLRSQGVLRTALEDGCSNNRSSPDLERYLCAKICCVLLLCCNGSF